MPAERGLAAICGAVFLQHGLNQGKGSEPPADQFLPSWWSCFSYWSNQQRKVLRCFRVFFCRGHNLPCIKKGAAINTVLALPHCLLLLVLVFGQPSCFPWHHSLGWVSWRPTRQPLDNVQIGWQFC